MTVAVLDVDQMAIQGVMYVQLCVCEWGDNRRVVEDQDKREG